MRKTADAAHRVPVVGLLETRSWFRHSRHLNKRRTTDRIVKASRGARADDGANKSAPPGRQTAKSPIIAGSLVLLVRIAPGRGFSS